MEENIQNYVKTETMDDIDEEKIHVLHFLFWWPFFHPFKAVRSFNLFSPLNGSLIKKV